jgi:hypothetical protein
LPKCSGGFFVFVPNEGSFGKEAPTRTRPELRCVGMLLTIAVILVAFWLLGFVMHLAGGLIHIVLVIAVIMFVLHFIRGRSA